MLGVGQPELLVILFVVLLFFGPSSLPKLSRTVGESAAALRDGFTDGENDKWFKDIANEVTGSAKEFKQGLIGLTGISQTTDQPTEAAPTATETQPDGYGEQGYGKNEST